MKKILLFLLISGISFSMNLKDGEYSVRTRENIWSWYPYTSLTVEDGEVVNATHDRIKLNGKKASEDKDYNSKMLKGKGTNPKRYSKGIPLNYFKANKNLDKMDTVVGATQSTDHFKGQMKYLLKKARKGETGDFVATKKELGL